MTRVGFVGLGAMGLPMAQNLVKAGFEIAGFDLKSDALDALAQAGGRRAQSAADAARGADALILMVVNAAQANAVLLDGGALEALARDGLVILMATCAPDAAVALADKVAASGRRFVDAPVSGGVAGATSGTLTIMAAAPQDVLAAARPILDVLGGERVFHVGERPGQGAMVKTVNQLLAGVHIAAAAEAFSLAGKAGIDPQVLLEILSGSAASSWMLKDRGPRMLEDDPRVASAVDIFVKDLGIVLDAGRGTRAALPLAAAAHQMFLAASGLGHGTEDDSQVLKAYRALNPP
jgi:putative dehydrogenase